MRFNATKCQVLRVTKKRKQVPASYSIHGHTLELVDSAKYLGVHLDSQMSFNTHVDSITSKANSTRAFLSRNLGHCNRKIKSAAYTTFIRPIVEYASTSWDPHTERNNCKVEKVQRSSARFVTRNYSRDPVEGSVSGMIKELQWPSLQERRQQSRLVMMFKIHNDLVDITSSNHLKLSASKTRGHSSRYTQIQSTTLVYGNSFFPRTIKDWNGLQKDPAEYTSLSTFKTAMRDGLLM